MSKMGKSMTVTELEALYVEIITRPHPTYRQRVRETLGNQLKQLRIKAEPKEVNEEPRPRDIVMLVMDNTGEKPTVSKYNKFWVGAALAKRLLI